MENLLLPRSRSGVLAGFELYRYDPSLAAAIIFILAFTLTTALHGYQLLRTRTWFFIPFFIGGTFEAVGYVGRAISATQTPNWALGPYIIQSILLLVAPALFAASIYMELGRIVRMVDGDKLLFIRRTWLTKIFVAGDVLSFLMQSSGGGLLASGSESSIQTGQDVIVGGLFVQLIFFGLFVIAGLAFHMRMLKKPTSKAQTTPWQKHMVALYAGSLLILLRSVFRVVEYLEGFQGYILSHEYFLYVFDACLMFLVMLIFNWFHPSEIRSGIKGGSYVKGIWVVRTPVPGWSQDFEGETMTARV